MANNNPHSQPFENRKKNSVKDCFNQAIIPSYFQIRKTGIFKRLNPTEKPPEAPRVPHLRYITRSSPYTTNGQKHTNGVLHYQNFQTSV